MYRPIGMTIENPELFSQSISIYIKNCAKDAKLTENNGEVIVSGSVENEKVYAKFTKDPKEAVVEGLKLFKLKVRQSEIRQGID